MRNSFIENYRSTPGIVYNPINNQRLNFTRQAPYYDARGTSIKNLDDAERNFGISERSYNALMDREVMQNDSTNYIRPLEIQNNSDSSKFEALPPSGSLNRMKIWRLDGQPFNLNSYLNSVEKVINDVSSSTDEKSLLTALRRGYNEWGLNAHVLGNNGTRAQDLYDSTAATMVRYIYDDAKANQKGNDFETLRENSVSTLKDQLIPKWLTEGVKKR